MPDLGPAWDRMYDVPSALKNQKAPGQDGIPVEAYKSSLGAKRDLFEMMRNVRRQEEVPRAMALGEMIPIFKNKGSSNDFSKTFIEKRKVSEETETYSTKLNNELDGNVEIYSIINKRQIHKKRVQHDRAYRACDEAG